MFYLWCPATCSRPIPYWTTRTNYLHIVFRLCMWHSQNIYWHLVSTSIYNLVFIAIDRFLATCYLLTFADFTVGKVKKGFVIMYSITAISVGGVILQVRFDNGACLPEYYFSGRAAEIYFTFYAVFAWFVAYSIPTMTFICLYGKVIYTLR